MKTLFYRFSVFLAALGIAGCARTLPFRATGAQAAYERAWVDQDSKEPESQKTRDGQLRLAANKEGSTPPDKMHRRNSGRPIHRTELDDEAMPVLDKEADLDDYLAYAALKNPGLQAAFNRWKAALERIAQVESLPDPKLTYGFFIRRVETRVGPQRQRLSLSQAIPWLGKLRLRGKRAGEAAEVEKRRYDQLELELFDKVKNAYAELYYLGRSITITEDNLILLANWEKVARAKYRVGTAPHAAVIKAQVELGKLEDLLETRRKLKPPLEARLNALLGRPAPARIPWPESLPHDPIQVDVDDLFAELAESNAELKVYDAKISTANVGIALAKEDYYPDFGASLSYNETGGALNPDADDSGKDAIMAAFSVTLPVWRKKLRAGLLEAQLRERMVRLQREDRVNRLESQLAGAFFQLDDAQRKIFLYRDTLLPLAMESLKATGAAFAAGRTDFLNFIDAQRILLEFELSLERALADHLQSQATIERLINRRLTAKTNTEASDPLAPAHNETLPKDDVPVRHEIPAKDGLPADEPPTTGNGLPADSQGLPNSPSAPERPFGKPDTPFGKPESKSPIRPATTRHSDATDEKEPQK